MEYRMPLHVELALNVVIYICGVIMGAWLTKKGNSVPDKEKTAGCVFSFATIMSVLFIFGMVLALFVGIYLAIVNFG